MLIQINCASNPHTFYITFYSIKKDRMDNIKRHILSVHEKKKSFQCNTCDASFTLKGNFKKTVHENKIPSNVIPVMLVSH